MMLTFFLSLDETFSIFLFNFVSVGGFVLAGKFFLVFLGPFSGCLLGSFFRRRLQSRGGMAGAFSCVLAAKANRPPLSATLAARAQSGAASVGRAARP